MQRKQAVIAHFQEAAHPTQRFDTGSRITQRAKRNEHSVVSRFLNRGPTFQGGRALDAGCGVGGYVDILLAKGLNVVGVDVARNMVRLCRDRFAGSARVEVLLADVETLPFRVNAFAVVLCIDTLQHLDDAARQRVLADLAGFVEPGGIILVEVKNANCPAFRLERFRNRLERYYTISSVTSALRNSGCNIEKVRGVLGPAFASPIVVVKARKAADART